MGSDSIEADAGASAIRIARRALSYRLVRSPGALGSALVAALLIAGALFAPWFAPHHPLELASIHLQDSLLPPAWMTQGDWRFPLGTDDQGRDLLSIVLYGLRTSLFVAFASLAGAIAIGLTFGLLAAYRGGWTELLIMRVADVQLSFPAILIALMVSGLIRAGWPDSAQTGNGSLAVLVTAIALASWVAYARTVRACALVEMGKDYIFAARLAGTGATAIMLKHVLPGLSGPVLILASINVATAVITEATLSFLGVGMPPTTPSLGTLIHHGNDFLFSGEWWLVIIPGGTLLALCVSLNLLGDWLSRSLNPQLS